MAIVDLLYPYQRDAAELIAARRRQGLFDEPGLGKTYTAMAACEIAGLFRQPRSRVLVLATATGAALTWHPKAAELLDGDGVRIVPAFTGLLSRRRAKVVEAAADDAPLLVIANHDFIALTELDARSGVNGDLFGIQWDAVIIDEAHKILPTAAVDRKGLTRILRGLRSLNVPSVAIRLAMTGTPDRGKLEHRYGMWCFLLPEKYNFGYPHERWMLDTFDVGFKAFTVRTRYGTRVVEQMYPKAIKDMKKWSDMDRVMTIRRTKGEVAAQLPPKRYVDIELPWPTALQNAYRHFQKEFETNDDGSVDAAKRFYVRSLQFAICDWNIQRRPDGSTHGVPIRESPSAKRDWLIDWIQRRDFDLLDGGTKVVITSQFSEVLWWLKDELQAHGYRSAVLDGSRSINDRLKVQQKFQKTNDLRIILLNMSLGDSIDLDAADDLIFIDMVQDPDKQTQTEDRVHRVGRIHNVVIWRLWTIGSVDFIIKPKNENRYKKTREVLEGARQVDYARRVLARLRA